MKTSEKCQQLADKHTIPGWIYDIRPGRGRCCRKTKTIRSPKPITRHALHVWLHEYYHAIRPMSQLLVYEQEYHCEIFAAETMREAGIEPLPNIIERGKAYVRRKILMGIRRGLDPTKINAHIVEWCKYFPPN